MKPDPASPLSGRKILITGAASGIGRATAQRFSASGAHLALLDINATALPAVAAELNAQFAVVDLRDIAATEVAIEQLARQLGSLDGVINSAGVSFGAPLEDLEPARWNDMVAVNLTAPYVVCRAALPWLRRAPMATIVNIASATGLLPDAAYTNVYAATKAGLIGFTKALAAEVGPNIRANVLCPGVTRTPMTANLDLSLMVERMALKRSAAADEMAQVLLFLTSEASSFVTGAVLAADGGRTYH